MQVKLFDIRFIPKVGVSVCQGPRACGKSTLARQLVRTLCQRDQPQRVILVGDKAIQHAGQLSISPKASVSLIPSSSASAELQGILDSPLQERRVILLDVSNALDNRPLWDHLFARAASLNIALIVTTQTPQQLLDTPRWKHVDQFFCFKDTITHNVQRMWETFFHPWTRDRSLFQKIFDQCTNAYECVVFCRQTPGTPWYYKTSPEPANDEVKPITEPQDLQPGCRVIYRTTRDEQDAHTFLSTLLTTLRTTRVLMYTPYTETHQLVVNSPGVKSVHRVMSNKVLLDVVRELDDAESSATLVFCETPQFGPRLSKLLDCASENISVVIFTDRDPPKIDGVHYFFKNKRWNVYETDFPRNVHGYPIGGALMTANSGERPESMDTQQLFLELGRSLQTPRVHPRKFDITSSLPKTGLFVCIGPAHCGKSTLAAQLAQVLWTQYDTCFIVLAGDDALRMKLPDTKTTLRLNVRTANTALLRLMEHQSAAKAPDHVIIVLDQLVWWDPKTMTLFKDLLSRHADLNIALIVATQHMQDLSLLTSHVDLLFAHPTTNKHHAEQLWDKFFTSCGHSDTFKSIMNARDPDTRYRCAVHVKATPDKLYQCAFPLHL